MEQLSNFYSAFKEPTSIGNLSLGIKHYGFSLYKENQIWIGYANSITKRFYYGIAIKYYSVSIKGYGQSGLINFTGGGIIKFTEGTLLGFSLHNPLRNSEKSIEVPLIFSLGLTHNITENASIHICTVKELEFPFSFRFGMKYRIIKVIDLRFGLQNEPNIYSGGIGINYDVININYSFYAHLELGLTHQFDIIIDLD